MQSQISMNKSFQLGDIVLKNRFVMAPLTRCRADPKTGVPTQIMQDYYQQRANFGLIITESTPISPLSNGFPGAGSLYTKEQAESWKKIVEKVHQKGGKIVAQLWHCGRAVPSEFIDGQLPISSSAVALNNICRATGKPYPTPKEMTLEDIKEVIGQFKYSAELAKQAGFDGVQLHGANGYLVDQFLRDGVNKRKDRYGGSIENRCRFMLEAIDALCEVYPSERVSIRFSPTGRNYDMYDSNPLELMKYALGELNKKNLQFVEIKRHGAVSETKVFPIVEDRVKPEIQMPNFFPTLRKFYKGVLIGNDGFNPESANRAINNQELDLVSFGNLAIANPDLPQRVAQNKKLQTPDYSKLFTGGAQGYSDYPMIE